MMKFLNWFRRKPKLPQVYLLMIEMASGEVKLAKLNRTSGVDKLVIATEENKYLLYRVGAELMADGLIVGYQVLCTSGPPIKSYDSLDEAPEAVPAERIA